MLQLYYLINLIRVTILKQDSFMIYPPVESSIGKSKLSVYCFKYLLKHSAGKIL
jgi:hypothetical protein